MAANLWRPLSSRERGLLEMLLSVDFAGVEELRVQARSAQVRIGQGDIPAAVILHVCDPAAPRARLLKTVPVQAAVAGADPPQELILFIKDGYLESVELVSYDGTNPDQLPTVDAFDPPWASSWHSGQ